MVEAFCSSFSKKKKLEKIDLISSCSSGTNYGSHLSDRVVVRYDFDSTACLCQILMCTYVVQRVWKIGFDHFRWIPWTWIRSEYGISFPFWQSNCISGRNYKKVVPWSSQTKSYRVQRTNWWTDHYWAPMWLLNLWELRFPLCQDSLWCLRYYVILRWVFKFFSSPRQDLHRTLYS